jgi:hypothetical protein
VQFFKPVRHFARRPSDAPHICLGHVSLRRRRLIWYLLRDGAMYQVGSARLSKVRRAHVQRSTLSMSEFCCLFPPAVFVCLTVFVHGCHVNWSHPESVARYPRDLCGRLNNSHCVQCGKVAQTTSAIFATSRPPDLL